MESGSDASEGVADLYFILLFTNIKKGDPRRNKALGKLTMAKMNNKTNKNWYDNNPFFHGKDAYDNFVEAMQMLAEEGELPKAYDPFDPEALTGNDIRQLAQRFMRDSGLNTEFSFAACPDCGKLHCVMIVDEFPENESGNFNE